MEEWPEPEHHSVEPEVADYDGEVVRLDFKPHPNVAEEEKLFRAAKKAGIELTRMLEWEAQCVLEFSNGHRCSVLRCHRSSHVYLFHENKLEHLFEIWKSTDSDPVGHLGFTEVQAHLRCLQRQPLRG